MSQLELKKMNINTAISRYIRDSRARGRLLLYRNQAELEFLKGWLSSTAGFSKGEGGAVKPGAVEDLITTCGKCGDVYNKKHGFGSGENGVFVIMNRPRELSDPGHDSIRAESIGLLKKMIKAMDLEFDKCYITNLVKCESRDVMNRPSLMFKNCENILRCELQEYAPRAAIVMGSDLPLKKLMNEHSGISWYNIEHPVVLVKNPEKKRPAWDVLKKAMSELKRKSDE